MGRLKRKSLAELKADCIVWNAAYPVGTLVRYYRRIHPREELHGEFTTQTEAQVLGDHTAVVWLNGYSGCVALEAVEPDENQKHGVAVADHPSKP